VVDKKLKNRDDLDVKRDEEEWNNLKMIKFADL
jgi:hypothetical protein